MLLTLNKNKSETKTIPFKIIVWIFFMLLFDVIRETEKEIIAMIK